ncbi:MAG: hypothetical protein IJG63_05190 [Oscillospiraceae bacterium]|nr:hypothetical protein [Oscillospiraceae bacterium]
MGGLEFKPWIGKAFLFLALSCPTAIVAAKHILCFEGMGTAISGGVVFRSETAVEKLANTTSVAVGMKGDGSGQPAYTISRVEPSEIEIDQLNMLTAHAVYRSREPLARMLCRLWNGGIDEEKVTRFKEIEGQGLVAAFQDGVIVAVGQRDFIERLGVVCPEPVEDASELMVTVNGKYAGRYLLERVVDSGFTNAVSELDALDIGRVVVVTDKASENSLAGLPGATELCVTDKNDTEGRFRDVVEMQLKGDKLTYIGDGVDDTKRMRKADSAIVLGNTDDKALRYADAVAADGSYRSAVGAVSAAREIKQKIFKCAFICLCIKAALLIFFAAWKYGAIVLLLSEIGLIIAAVVWARQLAADVDDVI